MPPALSCNLTGGKWGCKGPPSREGLGFCLASLSRTGSLGLGSSPRPPQQDGAVLVPPGCWSARRHSLPDPRHSLQEEGPGHSLA